MDHPRCVTNTFLLVFIVLFCANVFNYVDAQCSFDEWRCNDGECIPLSYRCSGQTACADNSNNENCAFACFFSLASPCRNGQCIRNLIACDGKKDCDDGSDEEFCASCSVDAYKCPDARCILKSNRCDGVDDCPDGSDEEYCTKCYGDSFRCKNEKCIRTIQRCDGKNDCQDNSDEMNCVCYGIKKSKNEISQCSQKISFDQKLCFDLNKAQHCCQTCYDRFLNYPPDLQCQHVSGNKATFLTRAFQIDLNSNPSYICSILPCYTKDKGIQFISSAPGTLCGSGKICLHGECVSHSTAPNVSESCMFGDDASFEYNNIKCKDLNTTTQHYCYMTKVKRSCCLTCQKFDLQLIDDVSLSSENLTLDDQCTIMNNQPSSFCASNMSNTESSICTSLSCSVLGTEICELFLAAVGTECGDGKVCLHGECIARFAKNENIINKNYWIYLIGSVLCVVISMTVALGIYLIKHNERHLSIKPDVLYEDVHLTRKPRHRSGRHSEKHNNLERKQKNHATEHYVYPEGNDVIVTYNDTTTSTLTARDSSLHIREDYSSVVVNDASVTTSSAAGFQGNMHNSLNLCEEEDINNDYTAPVQSANSDYICPVDCVFTEERKLQARRSYENIKDEVESNSCLKITESSNTPLSKHSGDAKVSWSEDAELMNHNQGTGSDTGSTSGYIVSDDGAHVDTNGYLPGGCSGHGDDYITPVDTEYVACKEYAKEYADLFPPSTGTLDVITDVISM